MQIRRKDYQQQKFHTKHGNDLQKLNAAAVVTIVVCRTAKARNTKWMTRPKPQKEESNGFKGYSDFDEEDGKIYSM